MISDYTSFAYAHVAWYALCVSVHVLKWPCTIVQCTCTYIMIELLKNFIKHSSQGTVQLRKLADVHVCADAFV